MARYRITCTLQEPAQNPPTHAHIVQVGTGTDAGWERLWTVQQVYLAILAGESFYTLSKSTGKEAEVNPFQCPYCSLGTLRSAPDAIFDNNLDSLPRCQRPTT
jgi:hypothetical protein